MLLCIVPIKPSAAALERLKAPPLDHALQAAGALPYFPLSAAGPDLIHHHSELYPFVFFRLRARSNPCVHSSNTSTKKVVDCGRMGLVTLMA
jgi:hypothetical protein